MKTAIINLEQPYKVAVVPTLMRYTLVRDMFIEEEVGKACEIGYEILAGKYVKSQQKIGNDGIPETKGGKPIMEDVLVDFSSPVLFDSGVKIIPFGLYLLIENYRAFGGEELLVQINGALSKFGLAGSLSDFVLSIESVQ